LNKVILEEKIAATFETKLFTRKISRHILGDITRLKEYPNPWYNNAYYNGVLFYFLNMKTSD
jgi:hypothetical protein